MGSVNDDRGSRPRTVSRRRRVGAGHFGLVIDGGLFGLGRTRDRRAGPAAHPVGEQEEEGVQRDRQQGGGQDQVVGLAAHGAQADAQGGQDEGELADLGQGGGDGQAGGAVQPEDAGDGQGGQRLADDDDAEDAQNGPGLAHQDHGVEQHADRDEEQHGEGVAQGQGPFGGVVAQRRGVHHQAGQEGAERERMEQIIGQPGDSQGDGQDAQGEELARAGVGDADQQPGDQLAADDQHAGDEQADLQQGPADAHAQGGEIGLGSGGDDDHGQHDQGDDDDHVLHDQPAHGDTADLALDLFALFQGAQQDHGGGDRQGEAHQQGLDIPQAQLRPAQGPAQDGGDGDLDQGAGHGDLAHLHQIPGREVQPDPEHQQDDADLGQLRRQFGVGDETARIGADGDARDQIADQGRQLQPIGQHAEHEGEDESSDQGENQAVGMRHQGSCRGRRGDFWIGSGGALCPV